MEGANIFSDNQSAQDITYGNDQIFNNESVATTSNNNQMSYKELNYQSNNFTFPEISVKDADKDAADKKKRHKERKIGEVIEILYQWRTLYMGFKNPNNGQIQKYTLDEAASIVGVCKKSLNDYFLIVKQAKKLGFEFSAQNREQGFGFMRTFVKKNKNVSANRSPSSIDLETDFLFASKNDESKLMSKSKKISKFM